MNITKRYVVIFFSSDVNKVIVQLRRFGFIRYGDWECYDDCLGKNFNDGGCVDGRCCCKK
ncbi:Defensin-like (DEFL) family protein [Arabidopsis thaliana]|nr:Defensin-like (DEFL) family protein [Arabidopsis thaliana]AEC05772.1 Defensin-like (DEFL) family protein [Arabidopsis thaliana]|eukprot:NP_001031312.1 Defensin-like (DEFL) family protein [Arabidopsis thaliana]